MSGLCLTFRWGVWVVSWLCLGCVSVFAAVSGLCLGCVWVVSGLCLSFRLGCVWVVSQFSLGCHWVVVWVVSHFSLGCVGCVWVVSHFSLGCVVSGLCLSCVYVVSGLCQGCVSVLFGLCKTLQIAVPEVFQGVAGTVLDVFHLFPICQVIRQTAGTGHHGLMASPPALCTSGPEPYAR